MYIMFIKQTHQSHSFQKVMTLTWPLSENKIDFFEFNKETKYSIQYILIILYTKLYTVVQKICIYPFWIGIELNKKTIFSFCILFDPKLHNNTSPPPSARAPSPSHSA